MKVRCKYNRCVVIVLLTISFVLSLLSVLDCKFVIVDIGFVPQNMNTTVINPNSKIGIGLWSVEDTSPDGLCIFSVFRKGNGSLTEDDDIYNTFFIADDIFVTVGRFLSLLGLLLALVNLVRTLMITSSFELHLIQFHMTLTSTLNFPSPFYLN